MARSQSVPEHGATADGVGRSRGASRCRRVGSPFAPTLADEHRSWTPTTIIFSSASAAPPKILCLRARRWRRFVTLNFAIDQGIARNFGGGKPDNAVLATVRVMESLPALGPVKERLARVRKLCGV